MDFEQVLAYLGEHYAGVTLYSVENRDMTDHETTLQYYLQKEEAIAGLSKFGRKPAPMTATIGKSAFTAGKLNIIPSLTATVLLCCKSCIRLIRKFMFARSLPSNSGSSAKRVIWPLV